MPYMTDEKIRAELARVERNDNASVERRDESETLGIVPVVGGMGTAALVGFIRSKFEDPNTGQWNVPGTSWDAEAAAFVVLAGVAFGGQFIGLDGWRPYAALGALGVGSHYAGEIARRYGKTGKLDFHVGGGVPPWDPTSFDPTQFGAPYEDTASEGLSSSGV